MLSDSIELSSNSNILEQLEILEQNFQEMVQKKDYTQFNQQLNTLNDIMLMCGGSPSQKKMIKKHFNNILNSLQQILVKQSLNSTEMRSLESCLQDLSCNKLANCSNVNKIKKQLGTKIEHKNKEKYQDQPDYYEVISQNDINNTMNQENQLLQFLKFCQKRNKQEVAIAVCDQDGKFVLFDRKLSEQILDQRKENLYKKSIFDFMIPLSKIYLWTKFNGGITNFLQENNSKSLQFPLDKSQLIITYTNYSQLARKKLMKYLRNSETKNFKAIKIKSQEKQEKMILENQNFELYFKYCKTLTARLTLINLILSKNAIVNINGDQNSQIEFNLKHSQIQQLLEFKNDENLNHNLMFNHLFLLEIRRAQHIQQFDYNQIRQDKKIKKWEEKVHQIINKKSINKLDQ